MLSYFLIGFLLMCLVLVYDNGRHQYDFTDFLIGIFFWPIIALGVIYSLLTGNRDFR